MSSLFLLFLAESVDTVDREVFSGIDRSWKENNQNIMSIGLKNVNGYPNPLRVHVAMAYKLTIKTNYPIINKYLIISRRLSAGNSINLLEWMTKTKKRHQLVDQI